MPKPLKSNQPEPRRRVVGEGLPVLREMITHLQQRGLREQEAQLLAHFQKFRQALSLKGVSEMAQIPRIALTRWEAGTHTLPSAHLGTLEAFFRSMQYPPAE